MSILILNPLPSDGQKVPCDVGKTVVNSPKVPTMMGREELEGLLAQWKANLVLGAAKGYARDYEQGVCVGLLSVLGYDNPVDMVYGWQKEAIQAASGVAA